MKEPIRSIFELKGLHREDKEYEALANRWEYVLSLKGEFNGLKESDIVLSFIPKVGGVNE